MDKAVRVLVVDDEPMVNQLVQSQLTHLGYVVAGSAFNGTEAITLARQVKPDVVLMDLQMPDPETGLDDPLVGLAAAQAIQEECKTPVILLTAHESPELIQKASHAGVGAYLIKPVRYRELDRAITIARARFNDLMTLRRLNADLEARNEELDAFAHTVAHDLKSLLAKTVGFTRLLEKDLSTRPVEESRSFLRIIASSGDKMSSIIDELLLLAGVRHMDKVELVPLDMARVVGQAQKRLAHLSEADQAEITLPERWPAALGHGPWVEEIWLNYMSNAIKYGARPQRVELGYDRVDSEQFSPSTTPGAVIRFWVRDNGPGLTAEEQAQLFTPFTRFQPTHVEGYGLGLSIVRRIVERLGGQVGIQSEVGKGSLFFFTLPVADQAL